MAGIWRTALGGAGADQTEAKPIPSSTYKRSRYHGWGRARDLQDQPVHRSRGFGLAAVMAAPLQPHQSAGHQSALHRLVASGTAIAHPPGPPPTWPGSTGRPHGFQALAATRTM